MKTTTTFYHAILRTGKHDTLPPDSMASVRNTRLLTERVSQHFFICRCVVRGFPNSSGGVIPTCKQNQAWDIDKKLVVVVDTDIRYRDIDFSIVITMHVVVTAEYAFGTWVTVPCLFYISSNWASNSDGMSIDKTSYYKFQRTYIDKTEKIHIHKIQEKSVHRIMIYSIYIYIFCNSSFIPYLSPAHFQRAGYIGRIAGSGSQRRLLSALTEIGACLSLFYTRWVQPVLRLSTLAQFYLLPHAVRFPFRRYYAVVYFFIDRKRRTLFGKTRTRDLPQRSRADWPLRWAGPRLHV